MKQIPITKADVYLYPIHPEQCEECQEPATCELRVRLTAPNKTPLLGKYCRRHGRIRAKEFSDSLPPIT